MRRYLGLLLIAIFSATACSDDTSGPEATVEGTYTLRTINGAALPFVFDQGEGFKVEYLGSTIVILGNNTFTRTDRVRITFGTDVFTEEQSATGTYTRAGNNFTFTATVAGETASFAAVWNGSNQFTYTETDDGTTYVLIYQK